MEVSGPVIKREPRGKSALNLVMVTKKGRRAQPRARANNHVNKPTGQHRPSPAPLSGGWHSDNTGRAPTSGNPRRTRWSSPCSAGHPSGHDLWC